ncbi:hypothetical protein KC19_4G215600 [Ceratodon purpureus]|uniref:Uncharacterized protein n=1 Tax=Ceratodon purpureus TaxID=3225 RepID=A0A8T0IB99_CERPU|nr:hypothetical protein KC19_4G215600 [Ceratodon purpureus]
MVATILLTLSLSSSTHPKQKPTTHLSKIPSKTQSRDINCISSKLLINCTTNNTHSIALIPSLTSTT